MGKTKEKQEYTAGNMVKDIISSPYIRVENLEYVVMHDKKIIKVYKDSFDLQDIDVLLTEIREKYKNIIVNMLFTDNYFKFIVDSHKEI